MFMISVKCLYKWHRWPLKGNNTWPSKYHNIKNVAATNITTKLWYIAHYLVLKCSR